MDFSLKNNDAEFDLPPSEIFTAESGISYNINELISSFNVHHYLYDFKNTLTSAHSRPFSDQDIYSLIKNYPKLNAAIYQYYNDHLLVGLIYNQSARDELFEVMKEINSVLAELTKKYEWAWIPDEVLALQLSSSLERFYTLSQNNSLKFLDNIIKQDSYLSIFMQSGIRDYLSKIHKGGCSSGLVEAFSKLYAQALTCQCYVTIYSPNPSVPKQKVSQARDSFFLNSQTSESKSNEPETLLTPQLNPNKGME